MCNDEKKNELLLSLILIAAILAGPDNEKKNLKYLIDDKKV